MNKNEKYPVINNQEDEDGYTFHPENVISNGKGDYMRVSYRNTAVIKEVDTNRTNSRRVILLPGQDKK